MSVRILPRRVEGRLRAPPSKSHTHRAYLMAALSGNGLVRNPLASEDTDATLAALRGLGFLVTQEATGTRIGGVLRPGKKPLDCRESGTTLRLVVGTAALADQPVQLTGRGRLAERPLEPLLAALRSLGARAERAPAGFPVIVQGPLRGGTCRLPGDVSSQFVSSLLFACPLAEEETTIELTRPLASRPYVELTLSLLRAHGVRVAESERRYTVPPRQKIRQAPIDVPGDYSSAAFLLGAAAVTGGQVTLEGLRADDPQGDRAILDDLKAFGAAVERTGDAVTVRGGKLHPARLDLAATPDLFPVLCAIAACAPGMSVLEGAPHLRSKESDRIHAMRENLRHFGIHCEERADGLVIHGGKPHAATIQDFDDHRIAMSGVLLALAADGNSVLMDPQVVAKSYPNFLHDLGQVAPGVTA